MRISHIAISIPTLLVLLALIVCSSASIAHAQQIVPETAPETPFGPKGTTASPLSPSTTAVEGVSWSMRIAGRGLALPAS